MKSTSPLHVRNHFLAIRTIVRRGLLFLALGAFLLTGAAGLAAQPQASVSAAVLSTADPQPVRAATDTQQKLAAAAVAEGVQIEWDTGLGTPFSIRGQDLGARQTFSAGKGLQAARSAQPEANAIAVLDNLSGIMGIRDAQNEFAAKPVQGDNLGFRHVRSDQIYQGLKVFGGEVIVHFNQAGAAYQVNGRYVPNIAVDVNPQVVSDDALRLATEDLAGLGMSGVAPLSQPELVIFAYKTAPRLVYALTMTADPQAANAWRYWIDTQDGKVLMRYNDVKKDGPATITGAILTGEGGTTNTVEGYNIGVNYYLYSITNLWVVYNNSTNGMDAWDIAFRPSSTWLPEDRVEMSAAINFDHIQSYYWTVFGRDSYDDLGASAWVNVHDSTADNAWNPYYQEFFFGDGDDLFTGPFGVLDICGHEFTHAVTEFSANLIYAYEPGALNESFSDIFGACVEFAFQPDGRTNYPGKMPGTADWLHGEDGRLYRTAGSDMRCPTNTATVGPGNEQPMFYKGQYWYLGDLDNGGVHFNGGVQNYFFYLLSDGLTIEAHFDWDTGQWIPEVVVFNGIGVDNAAQIAYRALTVYCSPYTDYTDIRAVWMSAAQDLIGPIPAGASIVDQAWSHVGYGSYALADLGTALNATYLDWRTAGNKAWFAETSTTHDGVMAAQSGRIKNSQQSRLQTTFSGPGTFSFWWKVSSQVGYDYLRFVVDDTNELSQISGETDWTWYAITNVSGTRTVTWLYTKDQSVSNGADAGWVDQVAWAPVWTPAVPAISATKGDYADRIRITWAAISGATDYLLYRHTINNSAQAQIIATLTSPIYDDTGVVPGTMYYYWMKARNCATVTALSSVDTGYRNLLPPSAFAASKGGYTGSVRLTWVAVTGATSYRIMRSTSADPNTAVAITETGATSYNDTTAVPGVIYYYWLTSRKWRPEGMLTSAFSTGDYGWRRSMAATDNALCDFDGDGKADPAVYQSATGHWMIMMSANRYRTRIFQLGGAGYLPVPQDFDGDGKTDIAVYSQATGQWLFLLSASGYSYATINQGGPGYIPIPHDFDGDGRADPAVLYQYSGLWQIRLSSRRYAYVQGIFGDSSYSPCPADYDNDGRTDPAVFQVRQSILGKLGYLISLSPNSAGGYTAHSSTIGAYGQAVPQDYDGDAKADPALFNAKAGLLNVWPSSMISAVPFSLPIGGPGFVPVAGDYDGDKKADPAVYQESTGTWVFLLSASNYAPLMGVFGGPGYEPVAAFP